MNTSYKTHGLTLDQKKDLFRRAKAVCRTWWVDELDCKKSWFRQRIDMDFEAALALMQGDTHFVVIHRHYEPDDYLEIASRTMSGEPDYFLWVQCDPKHIPELTEGLEKHEG